MSKSGCCKVTSTMICFDRGQTLERSKPPFWRLILRVVICPPSNGGWYCWDKRIKRCGMCNYPISWPSLGETRHAFALHSFVLFLTFLFLLIIAWISSHYEYTQQDLSDNIISYHQERAAMESDATASTTF